MHNFLLESSCSLDGSALPCPWHRSVTPPATIPAVACNSARSCSVYPAAPVQCCRSGKPRESSQQKRLKPLLKAALAGSSEAKAVHLLGWPAASASRPEHRCSVLARAPAAPCAAPPLQPTTPPARFDPVTPSDVLPSGMHRMSLPSSMVVHHGDAVMSLAGFTVGTSNAAWACAPCPGSC